MFRQLDVAATRFLHRRLHPYGFVPHDPAVREAVLLQRAVVDALAAVLVEPIVPAAGDAGRVDGAARRSGAAARPAHRRRIGRGVRIGGSPVRMTHGFVAEPRGAGPPGDQPRGAGEGDGASPGAAPAVPGRDDRPDQRRRARTHRRRGPVSAVDGRPLRRLRPAARPGRDARRAAGSRLGAPVAAADASRPRRHRGPAAARPGARARTRTRLPPPWRCRPRNTRRCSTRSGRWTSGPSGSWTPRARTARRCSSCAWTPKRARTCSSSASNCGACSPARSPNSRNASGRFSRSTTRKR